MKDKHKERIIFLGALASIFAIVFIGYEVHKTKATKDLANGATPGFSPLTAMSTQIPIYSWDNVATGTGVSLVGNSSATDTPAGGMIPFSVSDAQYSGNYSGNV